MLYLKLEYTTSAVWNLPHQLSVKHVVIVYCYLQMTKISSLIHKTTQAYYTEQTCNRNVIQKICSFNLLSVHILHKWNVITYTVCLKISWKKKKEFRLLFSACYRSTLGCIAKISYFFHSVFVFQLLTELNSTQANIPYSIHKLCLWSLCKYIINLPSSITRWGWWLHGDSPPLVVLMAKHWFNIELFFFFFFFFTKVDLDKHRSTWIDMGSDLATEA